MKSIVEDSREPDSHLTPKEIVTSCLRKHGYLVWNEMEFTNAWLIKMPWRYSKLDLPSTSQKIIDSLLGTYGHAFDIFALKIFPTNLFEILIIEIDGDDSPHSIWDMKPGQSLKTVEKQQANDKKAEDYVKFFMPDAYFLRMDKDEIMQMWNESTQSDFLWASIVHKRKSYSRK